jgi:hypothetical protein
LFVCFNVALLVLDHSGQQIVQGQIVQRQEPHRKPARIEDAAAFLDYVGQHLSSVSGATGSTVVPGQQTSEFPTVRFFAGERCDEKVLRYVIHAVAELNDLVVLTDRGVLGVDHALDHGELGFRPVFAVRCIRPSSPLSALHRPSGASDDRTSLASRLPFSFE